MLFVLSAAIGAASSLNAAARIAVSAGAGRRCAARPDARADADLRAARARGGSGARGAAHRDRGLYDRVRDRRRGLRSRAGRHLLDGADSRRSGTPTRGGEPAPRSLRRSMACASCARAGPARRLPGRHPRDVPRRCPGRPSRSSGSRSWAAPRPRSGCCTPRPGSARSIGLVGSGWTARVRYAGRAVLASVALWGTCVALLRASTTLVLGCERCRSRSRSSRSAGAADTISALFRSAILQWITPDRLRGRMGGLHVAVSAGSPRLGDAQVGVTASLIGAPLAVTLGGTACVAAIGVLAWRVAAAARLAGPRGATGRLNRRRARSYARRTIRRRWDSRRQAVALDAEVLGRLRFAVMRLARQLRQHAGTGATPSQSSALATIARIGPLSLGALAAAERVELLDGHEGGGRAGVGGPGRAGGDPTDRRVALVGVTPDGDRAARARSRRRGRLPR